MLGLLLFGRIARGIGAAAHRITPANADQSRPTCDSGRQPLFWQIRAPPRPALRETRAELATAREAGGGESDLEHQVLATPAHRVRQITLTLTLSRSTGRGNRRWPTAVRLRPYAARNHRTSR